MRIVEFFKDMFGSKEVINMTDRIDTIATSLEIQKIAIISVIRLIANCISKSEIETYISHKKVFQNDYYQWNYEPNKNQNSNEFINELITRLVFYNECLVVEHGGQFIIADNFSQREYAVVGNVFENVSRKDFKFYRNFKMDEVMYFKLNNENVTTLVANLLNGYADLLNKAIGKYTRSGGRKAIVNLDKAASDSEEKKRIVDEILNTNFQKWFEKENGIITLPKGMSYEEKNGEGSKKSTSEMVDILALTKEIYSKTAIAFNVPPQLVLGEVAGLDDAVDNLISFAIEPVFDLIITEANRKLYGREVLNGSYLKADLSNIRHVNIFKVAEKVDKLIASGTTCIDEIREKVGLERLNTDWSKKHYITKNYDDVKNLKGGDNNE